MGDINSSSTNNIVSSDTYSRMSFGKIIIYFGAASLILLIGILASYIFLYGDGSTGFKENVALLKDIMMIFVPIIATWISTVLTFYFSRDSFRAAAQHSNEMFKVLSGDDKLQTIYASKVMLIMDGNKVKMLKKEKDKYGEVKLQEHILNDYLKDKNINRLPVADNDGVVRYIIHQSKINEFLTGKQNIADLTLQDLIDNANQDHIFERFGTISLSATLLDAKILIDRDRACSDVFVTRTGSRDSDAIGWITNVIVEENSRL